MIILPEDHCKNRDFICPCGKGYFSYAALFTHVKQKHQGKPPGQIIKPKPENKRGRPRKSNAFASPQRNNRQDPSIVCQSDTLRPNTANLNQGNSNIKLISQSPLLKSTPGSQFKHYKADEQMPTHHDLPSDNPQEHSLLQDLTSNLVRINPHKVAESVLGQIQAAKLLFSHEEKSQLLDCLAGFIKFCRQGLKEQVASQIELLITVLLQHALQLREGQSFAGMSHIHLNDYVESFFSKLHSYIERWNLYDEPIFFGLNPMKILVVLYNWINSVYSLHYEECLSESSD